MGKNTDKGEGMRFEHDPRDPITEFFAPIADYGVTVPSFLHKTVTEQYPCEQARAQPRFHDRHQPNCYADGLEECIGCELCAWTCSADAIFVEAGTNMPEGQYSPGERFGRVYQINYLRCIFCGLYIETYPTRALIMSNELELVIHGRTAGIYEKWDLFVPLRKGMLAAPHPMVEGLCDGNYYRGEVISPTQTQIDWVEEYRLNDLTIAPTKAVAKETRR